MTYCCEYFPRIAHSFTWFHYEDGGKKNFVMPCITDVDGQKIRVNHCPVCGTEVRSIIIPEDDWNKDIIE